jgi:hypothetical protein
MLRDGHVHHSPSVMREHHQHKQQPTRRCGDDEEIGGHDLLATPKISKIGIHGFELTGGQRNDLVAFLHSLTDDELLHDPRFSNPWR